MLEDIYGRIKLIFYQNKLKNIRYLLHDEVKYFEYSF